MASIYLDEHLDGFGERLRSLGHDVTSAAEQGRRGKSDAWHFREALEQRRTILTWDKGDFEYLHRLWTALTTLGVADPWHSGILAAAPTAEFIPADWIPIVDTKLREDDPLLGRMLIWVGSKREWFEDRSKPERG